VSPVQGAGRVDNPAHYRVLYASDCATGAVAEAFGNHDQWTDQLLAGRPDLPGSRTALAEFEAHDLAALDLDDPQALLERELRPSRVVTRDRTVTQEWALRIYREERWGGIRWWSYHDPRAGSFGIWDTGRLRARRVVALDREHPSVVAAAALLRRRWS
jgi:RES domain-containing protein